MNLSAVLSFIALILAFGGFYIANYDFGTNQMREGGIIFTPPYYFEHGEATAYFNAYFFVFVFSLLFFGYSAPIALGIEGAKYASFYLTHSIAAYDFMFLFPEVIGAYSAILLGQGVLDDVEGKTVFEKWGEALKFFVVGLVLMVALIFLRPVVVK